MKPSLSLVVPCYNEEDNIQRFTCDWHAELSRHLDDFEIIIVNDASTDSTSQILRKLKGQFSQVVVLNNEKNKRYGETVFKGLKYASKDYVMWADADYSHYPKDIWKLWKYRDDYDAIWGVRNITHRDSRERIFFTIGNILLTLILFRIFLRDPNCAFKLYRREKLLPVLGILDIHPIMTTTKVAIKSKSMQLSIKEIPIAYLKRVKGRRSIRHIPAAFSGLKEMFYFRLKGR